ncbi:MAG: hypothetical protein HPY53_10685 [Brevinematales bacterium]|nr:hypothetical protein [Brevinematales bacterium]
MKFWKQIAAICLFIASSCAGRPVTKSGVYDPLPGIWMRTGDYADGTLIKVIHSGDAYSGILLSPKGKLMPQFHSNDLKWTNITPVETNIWTCGDMYFWINYKGGKQDVSNTGYLPCIIILSDNNTLFLYDSLPNGGDVHSINTNNLPQKWVKILGLN